MRIIIDNNYVIIDNKYYVKGYVVFIIYGVMYTYVYTGTWFFFGTCI